MKNKTLFFRFGFIILTCFLTLNPVFGFTVIFLGNPLSFSWHPDFFSGLFFGIAFFGSLYLGWLKNDK